MFGPAFSKWSYGLEDGKKKLNSVVKKLRQVDMLYFLPPEFDTPTSIC